MSVPDLADLKKRLRAEGFEIYRTLPRQIQFAERVRDNLLMDSGVSVEMMEESSGFMVHVTVRAQASHFPGSDETDLLAKAQELASEFTKAGYETVDARARPVPDPSHPERNLDTSHEVALVRPVAELSLLFVELKGALSRTRHSSDD